VLASLAREADALRGLSRDARRDVVRDARLRWRQR
jgi:hypothetical protein